MHRKKTMFQISVFLCLLSNSIYGQQSKVNSITENDLKAHLEFISGDLLKGRGLGEPGIDIAANYISSNLKRMNIKPLKGKDNFYQPIDFLNVRPDGNNSFLKISIDGNENIIPSDSILSLFPQPENIIYNGSVVFAGYGIIDSLRRYNDFENIEIENKIVMVMSRTSELAVSENSNNKEPFLYHTEYDKITNASHYGAKAILWVLDPVNKFKNLSDLEELYEYSEQALFPKDTRETDLNPSLIIITQHTADMILRSSGKSLSDLQNKINTSNKPASFEIKNTKIDLQIKRTIEEFKSSNIIGYIEGSDQVLKEECIIYTAHYDHLGIDQNGNVFNGADDNGSGTVALLELAEAFTALPNKPKRSVVFAWMTAEEEGGIGSQYYVNHPLFPLEKTLTCINIDMIGRVKISEPKNKGIDVKSKDSLFVITGHQSSELLEINNSVCRKMKLIPDYTDKYRLEFSDQYFFYKKGIPVLFYHTGFHWDMHSINDDIEKIDFTKMRRITQLAFLVGYEIANNNKKLEVDKSEIDK